MKKYINHFSGGFFFILIFLFSNVFPQVSLIHSENSIENSFVCQHEISSINLMLDSYERRYIVYETERKKNTKAVSIDSGADMNAEIFRGNESLKFRAEKNQEFLNASGIEAIPFIGMIGFREFNSAEFSTINSENLKMDELLIYDERSKK